MVIVEERFAGCVPANLVFGLSENDFVPADHTVN